MISVGKYEVEPVQDFLILKLIEEQSPAGLVMPQGVDKLKDDSAMFDVIDAGPGYYDNGKYIENHIQAGEIVMISSFGLGKIVIDKEKMIIGRARDVALTLKRKEVKK